METNEPHKSWVEISVEGDTESTEAICEVFHKHGANGISIEETTNLPISFPKTTRCRKPSTGGVIVKNF
mgnify:CR=1 FL=1